MPRGDGTGPAGMGLLTGRGLGYCAGYPIPGFMNPSFGYGMGMAWRRGFGLGRGRGFRWRARMFSPFITPQVMPKQIIPVVQQPVQQQALTVQDEKAFLEQEKTCIQEEVEALKQEIQEIEKRLKEL